MKSLLPVACLALLLALAGCGSGSTPPLSVACTIKTMPSGAIRAAVTVTNSTGAPARAIVYGPAFYWLQQIHPTLNPQQVTVQRPNHAMPVSYFGYAIPHVQPDSPAHLMLMFRKPDAAKSVSVAARPTVQADNLSVVDNPDCTIG